MLLAKNNEFPRGVCSALQPTATLGDVAAAIDTASTPTSENMANVMRMLNEYSWVVYKFGGLVKEERGGRKKRESWLYSLLGVLLDMGLVLNGYKATPVSLVSLAP